MSIANLLKKNDYSLFCDKMCVLNSNVVVNKTTTKIVIPNNSVTDILSTNFTPCDDSVKVKIEFSASVFGTVAAGDALFFEVFRDAVSVGIFEYATTSLEFKINSPVSISWVDEPQTTNQLTYKIQVTNPSVGGSYDIKLSLVNRSMTQRILSEV